MCREQLINSYGKELKDGVDFVVIEKEKTHVKVKFLKEVPKILSMRIKDIPIGREEVF